MRAIPASVIVSTARVAIVCALTGSAGCRQPADPPPIGSDAAPAPVAPLAGTVAIEGLTKPVEVIRDRWGIPHITASTMEDLFLGQGFVQASDRLFQMDLWRRSVQGRLSEVLGANFIERDAMTRRVQYRGSLDREWASYGPDAKRIATAFTSGINAWVARSVEQPPWEFVLAGWKPEFWQPEDLLNRTDAYLASRGALDEVFRARLVASIGASQVDVLLPLPEGRPTIVPAGVDLSAVNSVLGDLLRRVGTRPFFTSLAAPLESSPRAKSAADRLENRNQPHSPVTGDAPRRDPRAASNGWAVSGGRTDTGSPLLAGDLHRPLENPSLRYLVHLVAPGWNVIGATAPWLPGVAIGHNERIAWSMTASDVDVQDLYVERLNPDNPRQIAEGGRWVDVHVELETVQVKGRSEPFLYERQSTRRGVIVAQDRERHLAYALRWSGAEPGTASELGGLTIARARTWREFRAALARWRMPAVEFVYADVDGSIAKQVAAFVPVRTRSSGNLPAPGWTGDDAWRRWLTLDELPHAVNPPQGAIVSANLNPARTRTILDALAAPAIVDDRAVRRLQHDVLSWNAAQLVPLLDRVSLGDDTAEARRRLLAWNRSLASTSMDAALYVRWEAAVARLLAERRIPRDLSREFIERSRSIVSNLVLPSSAWFDGDVRQARDQLLVDALRAALAELKQSGRADLPWGRANAVTFTHPLAVSDRARRRFNIGPLEMPGYSDTVFSVSPGNPATGPSLQMIFNVADWDRSVVMNAPGQAESPGSPHFADLAALWVAGEYVPLSFSEAAVRANTESTLTLNPPPSVRPSSSSESQSGPAAR